MIIFTPLFGHLKTYFGSINHLKLSNAKFSFFFYYHSRFIHTRAHCYCLMHDYILVLDVASLCAFLFNVIWSGLTFWFLGSLFVLYILMFLLF